MYIEKHDDTEYLVYKDDEDCTDYLLCEAVVDRYQKPNPFAWDSDVDFLGYLDYHWEVTGKVGNWTQQEISEAIAELDSEVEFN